MLSTAAYCSEKSDPKKPRACSHGFDREKNPIHAKIFTIVDCH